MSAGLVRGMAWKIQRRAQRDSGDPDRAFTVFKP
jgi:hypothetical protein